MAKLDGISAKSLWHEHYRQMLVRDGERRFQEWHGEFLRFKREFLKDLLVRIREWDELRNSFYAENKRRT